MSTQASCADGLISFVVFSMDRGANTHTSIPSNANGLRSWCLDSNKQQVCNGGWED